MTHAVSDQPLAHTRLIVALCFAVAVIEGFDIQAIGVAAPRLAPELGLAPKDIGWVFFAANLALVFGASVGGWLADKAGRKPVFIGAVLAFGVATLATCFVTNLHTLLAARALAGFGFGAALPNMMAISVDISRPERRASTATLMFCGMPLGGGFSAALTQILPPDSDWRILFAIGGVLPLVLAPVLAIFMPETGTSKATEPRGRVIEAVFGGKRTWPSLLSWLALLPTQLVLYLILYWLPTLAVAKGLEPSVAPQVALSFNFVSVVGALFFGWLIDRTGPRIPLTAAYIALIGVLVALAAASGLPLLLILSGAAGFFLLGANYVVFGIVASYYPRALRGTGSGAAMAVGRTGAVIGPLLPGLLLTSGASVSQIIYLMAPAAAVAAFAVCALSFFKPAEPD